MRTKKRKVPGLPARRDQPAAQGSGGRPGESGLKLHLVLAARHLFGLDCRAKRKWAQPELSENLAKIVSFSLYGDNRLYCEGALENVRLARELYPGWRCRFYLADSVPEHYRKELEEQHCEVIPVQETRNPHHGRYWRFWVASDPNVERFVVRDVDSRLNPRERAAVEEWIQSGMSFHIMRDSFYHRKRVLAGMWGGIGGKLPKIGELVDHWPDYAAVGRNDQFMSEVIFPLMGTDYLCHDSIGFYDDALPFPPHAHLKGTSYVGEIVPVEHRSIDLWRRVAELEDLRLLTLEKLVDCEARLEGLLASASWRWSSPLRTLKGKLRNLPGRRPQG